MHNPSGRLLMMRNMSKSQIIGNLPHAEVYSELKLNTNNNLATLERESPEILKDRVNLNKDIFFSAFYEEINNYYKLNACSLKELDETYPRKFRKVDRKEEIMKNIDVLVKSLVRNQPSQIQNTLKKYLKAHPTKRKINENSNNVRSHSVNSRPTKRIYEPENNKKKTEQT